MGLVISVSCLCASLCAFVVAGLFYVHMGGGYYAMFMDLLGLKMYPGYQSCKSVRYLKNVTDQYIDQYQQGMLADSEEVLKREKLLGGMLGFQNAAFLANCSEEETGNVSGAYLTQMANFSQ